MKKILAYIFIFSIFTCSVIAANVYEAKSFAEHPEQIVILEERDVVKLNWDNKEHKLMVRQIYADKNKVDITAFIEGSEVPYYATITSKTLLQLDFDQDLEYDLKVSIFNILQDEKVVALKLEKIEKESIRVIIKEESENNYSNQNMIYAFAGIILLGLILWKKRFFLKTYRKFRKH